MKNRFLPLAFIYLLLISIKLPAQNQKYKIKNVGTISVPITMELQSGKYGTEVQKLSNQMGYELPDGRVVFQQKGMNNHTNTDTYARVILNTEIGYNGQYFSLNSKYFRTRSELLEAGQEFKAELLNSFAVQGMELLDFYEPKMVSINGANALCFSYTRHLGDNPITLVSVYQFHNVDRVHYLTISYWVKHSDRWADDMKNTLNSFKITSVRK